MSGSSLPLAAAAIAVACAIIIASNGVALNEKLAELFCKKGETMDCMFSCRFHTPTSECLNLTFSADDRLFPTKMFTPVDYSNAKKSDVQNYWDSNTCNTKWNFPGIEKGSKTYYEATKKRKYEIEPHIPIFAEYERWKGKKVLEVGGGFCTTALDFALAGAILTVVDMSPTSLKLCRERFIAYNPEFNNTVRFVVGDAEKLTTILSADVGTFDLVWSFGVIHHSPEPQKSMNEFAKLVKPGGEVKIMVYALASYKLFWVQRATNRLLFQMLDCVW